MAYLVFISVYLLLYGGINWYAWKLLAGRGVPRRVRLALAAALALLVLGPILTRAAERNDYPFLATVIAWPAYLWMGVVFILFWVGLLLRGSVAGLVLWRRHRRPDAPPVQVGWTAPAALLLAALLSMYAAREAHHIDVERVTVATAKLPPRIDRLRVVQVSDLHLGILHGRGTAQEVADLVMAQAPDLIVFTGDIVDGDMELHGDAAPLAGMTARYGKYAITGNHEFYAGIDQAMRFLYEAGFAVLRGESVNVQGVCNLAGIDDYGHGPPPPRAVDERELLLTLRPQERFTILLRHRPTVNPATRGLFDLQLSGHTHGGQLFPLRFLVRLINGWDTGRHDLGDGSLLYVSRGTGTWGPPLRLGASPEIVVFDIVRR